VYACVFVESTQIQRDAQITRCDSIVVPTRSKRRESASRRDDDALIMAMDAPGRINGKVLNLRRAI